MTTTTTLKKQHFSSPHVAEYPPGHWSNCIRVGDQIWLSGFTARANDLKTIQYPDDAYEQAKVIFAKASRPPAHPNCWPAKRWC